MGTQLAFLSTLLLLHCLMAIFAIAALQVHDINTDQSSLLAFRDRISYDPNSTISRNWSTASPVCNWIGITCGHSHRRVVVLNLSYMGLVGTISPHLGNLSFLSSLDLSNNSFHGSIPGEFAQLRRLKQIRIKFNKLSGEIPSWFALFSKLEGLFLDYNSFTGAIPKSLFNITSLKRLYLRGNNLVGFLPPNVFNATSLVAINFELNQISGPLPHLIMNSSPLQSIALSSNNLSGQLPELIFPNLRALYLSDNQFSGELPLSLFNCKQLRLLSLSVNNFKTKIPPEIGNLTMLTQIYLGLNSFSQGTIPNEIGNLQNLEIASFQDINLVGNIPPTLFNISTLISIDVSENQLSGNLPSSLGSELPNLQYLTLSKNYLSGKIPNSLMNATMLAFVELPINSFSGSIPDIFGNLENLESLILSENNLTIEPPNLKLSLIDSLMNCKHLRTLLLGQNPFNSIFPISIGNLSRSLEYLDFSDCNMRGNVPATIGNLSGLLYLGLGGNQLTGSIPIGIGKLQNLQRVIFSRNKLEEFHPYELCQLKRLEQLNMEANGFSGPIPTCFGNMTSLRMLWLNGNTFNSTIPSTLWNLSYLLGFDLSFNEISGSLASEMSNLKVVIEAYVSYNQLSGRIPSSIGELKDLKNLSLAGNEFEGPIPESFGSMVSLELLDLSKNNLSGVIPKQMEALVYLKLFNVSFNELEGQIPMGGPFANFSAQSFMGNKKLCGAPQLQLPKCKAIKSRQSPKKTAVVLKYVLPAVIVMVLLFTFIYLLLKRKKHQKRLITEGDTTLASWRRISYYELQQATNGFIDANLLGIGSFGKVYKGILSDGANIAVKVFNLELEGVFKSFDAECEVLCNVRHRNLIKIISSCSNIDFKALVLSYMSNGSLQNWLYSHNHCLSMIQRLSIMIDVATALDYLHHGCSIPIVHCDLKPSNILLDEDMVAHVTDFGVAKFLGRGDSITQTLTLATIGYMAPEYGLEGIVSRPGDVYSYGILLMETFTQKSPTNDMFEGEYSIKHWVKDSYPHALIDVIDAKLLAEVGGQFDVTKDCLVSIMGLALDCTVDSPGERKSMTDVLAALKKIKIRFANEARHLRLSV